MKKKITIISLAILALFIGYLSFFNMSQSERLYFDKIEFVKDEFVDSSELSNKNSLAGENDQFQLILDETTSYFKVINKNTGVTWQSNPTIFDPWQFDSTKTITKSALDKQKSTLELSYFNETGSIATINNFNLSISHPESVLFSAGKRTYSIRYVEDGFQVLYYLQNIDIDYTYFPKYLKPEILDAHPQKRTLQQLAYKKFDEELGVYYIEDYESISLLVRKELYKIFYGPGSLEYTREQAISENESYGYTNITENVRFEIAVEVKLTQNGVKTSVIQDSIYEAENAKLATVSLYPLFGTAISRIGAVETEGYIVLPDGSGAVMNFNNGKYYQQPYSKRLYGIDLGKMSHKMPETQEKINIPLYGMVKENGGFAAIITKGDTMATIFADVSGRIDSYNKVYPTFNFRENEAIILGTGFNMYALDLWTDKRVDTDFTVEYTFLDESEADYVNIARVYREYLEDRYDFNKNDESKDALLTLELLGAFEKKSFILGIPYYRSDSLTNFKQAEQILTEIKARGIDDINVIYKGMVNGGLSQTIANDFNIEGVLGGKRGYSNLLDYAKANQIEIYPEVTLMSANGFDKMFDSFRYSSNRLDGNLSLFYEYHLPSKLSYSASPGNQNFKDDYVINPLYYNQIVNDLFKRYQGDTIAFGLLGNRLGGTYGNDVLYKQEALLLQLDVLNNIEKQLLLKNPLGFALPYANYIVDLPMETTLYAILDYQIPLLQLVLSGKVDYTTNSFNLSSDRTSEYMFLKAIETGSNIKYTLSYDRATELRDTKFNYYFSTEYSNWIEIIDNQIDEMNELGIHKGYLTGHERLRNNVFKITYSHGLEIIINYNLVQATDVLGYDIPAMDYLVIGED